MKAKLFTCLSILTLMSLGQVAFPHHSTAMFDQSTVTELTGTIRTFQFTNPHSWVQLLVVDENGEEVEWSLEWGSPNRLGREGIRPSTFPQGATVSIRTNPMLDGSAAGLFLGAKFENGTVIGAWPE